MSEEEKEQHDKHIKILTKRTSEDIEVSENNLLKLSICIQQLNSYIDNDIGLSSNAIYNKLKWMFSDFSFNFIYKLNEKTVLRRARKFEEKNSSSYCFKNTQELSYIQDSAKATMGRLNKVQQSMYYGVISDLHFNQFDTALSEINADEFDYINILDSETIKPLTTLYIGAFDLFIKNKEVPTWIHSYSHDIYKVFQDKCHEHHNNALLNSYILCSAFFADILSRKKHGNLYEVTSILSSIIFEAKEVDSIIYESVQVKSAPSIAIRPEAVDKKIKHTDAISFHVTSNLGYGIYYGKEINKGVVTHCGCINWEQNE